jgi:hypothetical protein
LVTQECNKSDMVCTIVEHPHTKTSALRSARALLIPQVPELASQLAKSPLIIHDSIADVVAGLGFAPDSISKMDYNKTERHTLAGHLIVELQDELVEGAGRDAQLRYFSEGAMQESLREGSDKILAYSEGLFATQHYAAAQVEGHLAKDTDWYSLAKDRYGRLGKIAYRRAGSVPRFNWVKFKVDWLQRVPDEGRGLDGALRTEALASGIDGHLRFVDRSDVPKEQHTAAAHDTAVLLLAVAGLHVVEMMSGELRGYKELPGKIIYDAGADKYRVVENSSLRKKYFRRVSDKKLPNARLQCPAHVDGTLQDIVHAAINAASALDVI